MDSTRNDNGKEQGVEPMALRITSELVKFKNLQKDLGLSLFETIGLLEAIWHFTAKNAIRGDIGQHSDQEIAEWIGWKKDAHQMMAALMATGWLDPHPKYRVVVHDWHQHADKSIKTIMRNRKMIFVQEEDLTEVPKVISGAPVIQIGCPPESREQRAETVVQSAEAREVSPAPSELETVAAELATEFWSRIPGLSRPTLPELRSHFEAKLHWLRENGRNETERIQQAIVNPKRDKAKANTINKMFLFWQDCGLEENQHGRRRDVTSRDSGKSAGGGRAENIKPRIVNLDP